jgi:hypothetical protein
MDRHEIADQRHGGREHPAGDQASRDPQHDQQTKIADQRARQRSERHDQERHVHQPGFSEDVADAAEHRLHQRIGEGVGARQQRCGCELNDEIGGDLRDHRLDRAREQGRGEHDHGDDFQDRRDDCGSVVGS